MPLEATFAADSNRGYGFGLSSAAPGLKLTSRTLPVTFNMNGFAKGGTSSLWFVGANGSTSAATSSDGITWTTITASRGMYYNFAGNPGTSYVSGDGNNIQYSSNGTSWTLGSSYWSGSLGFMKYFPAISVYIKKLSGSAMESGNTTGVNWSNRPGTSYTAYDGSSNGNVVGWPTYGASYFEYTTTSSWTSINATSSSLPSTKNWVGTAYDSVNNKFVVFDDNVNLAYSTSGTGSWTQITRPSQSGVSYQMASDGGGGAYFLGGYDSYLYSTDATSWINVPMTGYGSGFYYQGRWDSANSRFLIMKQNSTQYFTGTI